MTEETGNGIKKIRKSTVAGGMWSELGKLPPQAIETEDVILGAILLEQDAIEQVADWLPAAAFYKDEHKEIFEAVLKLYEEKSVIDILTVCDKLRNLGKLDFAGGPFYISELTNRVGSGANLEYHARIVYEKYLLRKVIESVSILQVDAFEETTNALELIVKAQEMFNELGIFKDTHEAQSMAELIPKIHKETKKTKEQPESKGSGLPTPFKELNRILGGGMHKSDLIILGARPGQGKSSFAVDIARHWAVECNSPGAIFSLEMTSMQLTVRLVSGEINVNSKLFRSGQITEANLDAILDRTQKLQRAPLYIDDTPSITSASLSAKMKKYIKKYKLEWVIIDYLQLMSGPATSSKMVENREQVISKISRSLKGAAKDFDIPILALSQLSRAVEQRGKSKKPQLSDLKESGSIEQDADIVIFIYRPEYYDIFETEDGNNTNGLAEISVAKNRHGDVEDFQLYFQASLTKFSDYTDAHKVPYIKGAGNKIAEDPETLPF